MEDGKEDDKIVIYKRYLDELRHEDSLQNTRIMWLLIFEGFLLSTLKDGKMSVSYFIVAAGIILAVISFLSIFAAIMAWRNYHDKMKVACNGLDESAFPQLARQLKGGIIRSGHSSAVAIPSLFILIWTIMLIIKLKNDYCIF